MQAVRIRADMLIRDVEGNELALVELKNRQGLTPDVAASLRRNLVGRGMANRSARFFVLLSQDAGYLWDETSSPGKNDLAPAVEFSMVPVVAHYLPSLHDTVRLSESQLELAVTQWLWDLANDAPDRPIAPETALSDTDFSHLIKGGRIDTEFDV